MFPFGELPDTSCRMRGSSANASCSNRDTPSQSWYIPEGTFTAHIGASSADIRLTGTFQV